MEINYTQMSKVHLSKNEYDYDVHKLQAMFNEYKNICLNDEGKHQEIKKEQIFDILNRYNLTIEEFDDYIPIRNFNSARMSYAMKNGFSHQ